MARYNRIKDEIVHHYKLTISPEEIRAIMDKHDEYKNYSLEMELRWDLYKEVVDYIVSECIDMNKSETLIVYEKLSDGFKYKLVKQWEL